MPGVTVGVCRETHTSERRVALVPASVAPIAALGADVAVQSGAGAAAGFTDAAYAEAGAAITTRAQVLERAGLVVGVRTPGRGAEDRLRCGQTLVGMLEPLRHPLVMRWMADRGLTAISVDLVPATPFGGSPLDAAASQAALVGREAVRLALAAYGQETTPTVPGGDPIRMLVVGCGPAARQAAATARAIGVEAEPAPTVRTASRFDVVVVTGREQAECSPAAPVGAEAVAAMPPGSVIVDTTVDFGGGAVEAAADDIVTVVPPGVTVIGAGNLPSRFPAMASMAYAEHVTALLGRLIRQGRLVVDLSDPLQAAIVVTHRGGIVNDAVVRQVLDITAVAGLP